MDTVTFVRKPFTVEAVEITKDNIEELAPLIGKLRTKENGTPFIQVDRKLVPNIYQVFIGFWMTKMDDNIRCYSRKIFREQFIQSTPDVQSWIEYLNAPLNTLPQSGEDVSENHLEEASVEG